ncbi:EamA family transporter [Aliivibrio fischeri]|uniref:DMT family transporter n=1 Tax=Aliivibrio fischeri TaxID=668 RepID=UPI0012D94FC3|nr:DMT family transporter [Aliivibrio fischeri]MUK61887.1 EamA family transporter [Aliivibrio fischeri]MUK69323.1 EamA family transporter [Aliivibrio fischeri]MUK75112.1 EamA family transporter [Aliivibrio fischeri]MUL21842.1 EamA family transporter [Aliivibrio fischeri]MUL25943.1 EamA family transporter [Aliivibrio fischeri]
MLNILSLFTLAALWGGSFLFVRIAANPLGPAILIETRVAFAALTLLVVSFFLKKSLRFMSNIKHFLILGLFNSALPFLLFAYSAQVLNVSTLAILNSTAPIWGAIIGAVWTRTGLSKQVIFGLILGMIGVSVLVGWEAINIGDEAIIPIIAALIGAFSYGVATNYAKNAPSVEPFNNAHGSMWASVLLVLPLVPFMPAREEVTSDIIAAVFALGAVCTGLAYLLYFRLIKELGASSALTVTFIIPVFGILWGYLFLGETVGVNAIIGTILVVIGTMFVTGFASKFFQHGRI